MIWYASPTEPDLKRSQNPPDFRMVSPKSFFVKTKVGTGKFLAYIQFILALFFLGVTYSLACSVSIRYVDTTPRLHLLQNLETFGYQRPEALESAAFLHCAGSPGAGGDDFQQDPIFAFRFLQGGEIQMTLFFFDYFLHEEFWKFASSHVHWKYHSKGGVSIAVFVQ